MPYLFAREKASTTAARIVRGVLVLGALSLHTALASAQTSPIVSLPLDDGSGITAVDVSGNGNNGRLLNGATWAPGRSNGAVSFDGVNDNLVIDGSTTITSITSGVTVAAWVYRQTNQSGGVAVISRQLGTGYSDHWVFGFIDGQYRWFVNTSNGYSNTSLGGDAPLGQWVHVVGTYDGSSVRFYVNGVLQFSTSHSGVFPADSTGISVGAGHNDAAHTPMEAFNGRVDDLRVYSRGLSAAEVSALYVSSGGSGTGTPPTVSMTGPGAGAVKGKITATAAASDDRGVVGVQFMVDGSNAGAEDTTAPYAVTIDTTQFAEGQHALSAVARDGDGNVVVSSPVNVVFDNTAVMPLGDSLTSGVIIKNGTANFDDGGYRRYLWESLRNAGIEDMNFVGSLQSGIPTMDRDHEGHGGWTTEELNAAVAPWISTFQPDVVLLLMGLNDLNQGATPSLTLTRLGTLLDQIHSLRPGARIVLANHPGILAINSAGVTQQTLMAFNSGIPSLVSARAQQGWNIAFADLFNLAGLDRSPGSSDFSSDGFHPSLAGYSKIATVWYAALNPALASDTTPPTIPTGLSATATSTSTVNLSWNASADNLTGVAAYRIYRNAVPVATTAARTFLDTGLAANTLYSYAVTAIDFVNNESAPSAPATAATGTLPPDVTPPSAPTGLTATALSGTSIQLAWTGSTDVGSGGSVSDTFNRANGGLGSTWTPMNGTFQILSQHVEVTATQAYTTARLSTWTGGGDQWAEVAVTPVGLNSGGGPLVRVSNGGANQYLVDYNGRADHKLFRVLNGVFVELGGWTDAANVGDVVRLEAVGSTIRVLVNGVQKVLVINGEVTGGVPGIYTYTGAGEHLQLDTFTAASAGAVAGYRIYRDGAAVATTAATTYVDSGRLPNTLYGYRVTAYDASNNESAPSAPASATTGGSDITPPSVPTGLTATATSPTSIQLAWTGSTDVGSGGSVSDAFNRANGGLGGTWTGLNGTFQILNQHVEVTATQAYTTARLSAWTGGGDQWAEVAVTPVGLNSGGGPLIRISNGGANQYLVDYNGRADHKLFRVLNGVFVAIGGWTDPANVGDVVRLEAIGSTIRVLVNGVQKVAVINGEVTGGVPGIYTYTGAGEHLELDTFTAASAGAVAGYRIYRDGAAVATTTATTYVDSGRLPSTLYGYRVTAYDASGNESAPSAQATATTPSTSTMPTPIVSLPFNETNGTVAADVSGNGNNATLRNGPVWVAGLVGGGALAFDGSNDIAEVPHSTSLDTLTTQVTVAAWVWRSVEQSGGRAVLSRQLGASSQEHWAFGFVGGQYRWFVNTTSGYSNTTLGGPAPVAQWVHIAGTYDGAAVKFYVNGVLQFSAAHSGTFPSDATGLSIGAGSNDAAHTPVEGFQGVLDEVKVYPVALTASQIMQLYSGS